ncbi:MAG TPA: acryloyl-CoA reductase, partial [Rubrivivax sp.]|nr:acryloyl-CoA reductase [Rubrivivax sp.]
PGEVAITVAWSGINYKDALAATGAGRILKRFPLTVGIDLAGRVRASADARFAPGQAVAVVGCGIGEEIDGGFAEQAVVPGDMIVALPEGLSLRDAMAIGTAGFTAAMGIQRLEDNGLAPGQGPVLVNGASGGVGSLAVNMLAGRGYEVSAVSAKASSTDWLRGLGASEVLPSSSIDPKCRPLEKARWAAAIDNLGGDMLAWLCATMQPLASIASIGLAASPNLNTTVMPFILRGINLLPPGIAGTRLGAPGERLAACRAGPHRVAGTAADGPGRRLRRLPSGARAGAHAGAHARRRRWLNPGGPRRGCGQGFGPAPCVMGCRYSAPSAGRRDPLPAFPTPRISGRRPWIA